MVVDAEDLLHDDDAPLGRTFRCRSVGADRHAIPRGQIDGRTHEALLRDGVTGIVIGWKSEAVQPAPASAL